MRYKCPSCFVGWSDQNNSDPFDKIHSQLCRQCALGMDRKELINWQMQQIDQLSTRDAIKALSYAFRYLEGEIDELRDKE